MAGTQKASFGQTNGAAPKQKKEAGFDPSLQRGINDNDAAFGGGTSGGVCFLLETLLPLHYGLHLPRLSEGCMYCLVFGGPYAY